ncbi:MAG TPA: phosphoribosyltransferase family protein [Candidatus Paceibacterota bacterium]
MKLLWELILRVIFPDSCIACKTPDTPLCLKCLSKIEPAEREVQGVFVCYSYRDPIIRNAIWRLKYKNHRTLALPLSQTIADFVIEELADQELFGNSSQVLVTAIPQSKKRTRDRGYNQSALLAEGVAKKVGLIFSPKLLEKVRETARQVEMKNRQARIENLKGAFHAREPEKVKGKTIIIIDDVTTTGATFAEARRALKSAGAKRIIACALAH